MKNCIFCLITLVTQIAFSAELVLAPGEVKIFGDLAVRCGSGGHHQGPAASYCECRVVDYLFGRSRSVQLVLNMVKADGQTTEKILYSVGTTTAQAVLSSCENEWKAQYASACR